MNDDGFQQFQRERIDAAKAYDAEQQKRGANLVPTITPYRALILLFRENAITMSDRNSYLWTLIEDGLADSRLMANGLTEAETNETASVKGIVGDDLPPGELTEEEWRAEAAAAGSRPPNCAAGLHDWDIENGMCRKCFACVTVPGNCAQCGRQLRLDGKCVECNFA